MAAGSDRLTRVDLLFWVGFVLSVLALRAASPPNPRLAQLPPWVEFLVSPLMLPVFWFALRRFRGPLRAGIARLPLAAPVKFVVVGLLLGVGLAVNWTICFDMCGTDLNHSGVPGADLHPNALFNTVLYIGPFGGLMLGWYLLRRRYTFGHRHVFWIEGLRGALTEQAFLLPISIISGNIVSALALLLYLIPAYGVVFAPVFLVMPAEDLPRGTRRPRLGGYLLFILVPWVLFYGVAAIWYAALNLLPHG